MQRVFVTATRAACFALCLIGSAGAAPAGPQISAIATSTRCVALTFDDGPHASLTPKLLDILKARGVRATFFVVGSRVKAWPAVVRRASRDGHEIGNHSWSHPALPKLGSEAVRKQLASTDGVIASATGKTPKVLRAPYGALSGRVAGLDKRPIGWSVDPLDWRYKGSERIVKRVVAASRGGAIVVMHDTKARTVAAVPALIAGLQARGFRFVTVSEMLSGGCGRQFAQSPRGGGATPSTATRTTQSRSVARTARTEAAAREPGPDVTRTSPSGGTYAYREGARTGTYTINGRTFTYERD